jgi:hypothetical protein
MRAGYRMTGAMFGAGLRIGDTERSTAVEQLNDHYAAGRLTRLEHDERVDFALAAKTQADLLVLFADLPQSHPGEMQRRRRHRGIPMFGVPLLGALIVLMFVALAVSTVVILVKALPVLFLVLAGVIAFRIMRHRHHRHW